MKLLWLTDLHLDKVGDESRAAFYRRLRQENADAAVITGDVSESRHLSSHLRELARALEPVNVFFVLGNHDFYWSSFCEVERIVSSACKDHGNLCHLGEGEIIPLANDTALVGHRGWADGRAGWGERSLVRNPDHECIRDFQHVSRRAVFERMADLGRVSAGYFRDVLPYALKCHRRVFIATHAPPFAQAATYNGKRCGPGHLPHYVNMSAGGAIAGIAKFHPKNKVTVLCGHTHSRICVDVAPNIRVRAGQAQPGSCAVECAFSLS